MKGLTLGLFRRQHPDIVCVRCRFLNATRVDCRYCFAIGTTPGRMSLCSETACCAHSRTVWKISLQSAHRKAYSPSIFVNLSIIESMLFGKLSLSMNITPNSLAVTANLNQVVGTVGIVRPMRRSRNERMVTRPPSNGCRITCRPSSALR